MKRGIVVDHDERVTSPSAVVAPDGEHLALAVLFRAEYEPMVRVAYLLVGSVPVAEELVQDAFVRVQQRLATVQSPGAYLQTCVVNGCRSHLRRRRTERVRGPRPDEADVAGTPPPAEPDEVLSALDGLPVRQRTALVLRYYLDWSEAEIAAALDCRPATVRSLVHRGLARLREVMEP